MKNRISHVSPHKTVRVSLKRHVLDRCQILSCSLLVILMFFGGTEVTYSQTALRWTSEQRDAFTNLPVVKVATDATWPPMEYHNRNGEIVGFDIDLLREIGRRAGFRPLFQSVAWDGIFSGLISGSYDMIASSVTILEVRKRVMLFSEPYLSAAQYVVVPRNDEPVNRLEELSGRSVGAQIGTTGARIAREAGATVRAYDDIGLAIEDLLQSRLAGIVADVAIIEYYVLANLKNRDRLRIVETPYATEQYGFAIRQDRPDLLTAVNRVLQEMKADGQLHEIRDYWFHQLTPVTP